MYNAELVEGKLRRWNNYMSKHTLPQWEQIPNIGLYMEQVITLLTQYLSFLPQKDGEEQVITTSAINNYVRMKVMPPPEKKKYDRMHIAYLIMICSLKQSLSMSDIQKIIPSGLDECEIKDAYTDFVARYTSSVQFFITLVEEEASKIFDNTQDISPKVKSFVFSTAVVANFSKILTTKMLDLQDQPFSDEAVADKE